MYKFRINKERNSFKFGVLAGICFFLAIDNIVGMLTISEMQVTRFLLAIIFITTGMGCYILGRKKK